MKAIETTGTIDKAHQLVLDDPLPEDSQGRVKVIILIPDEDEIDEQEWLRAAATNPSFDFLKNPQEDIYSLTDGKPNSDEA